MAAVLKSCYLQIKHCVGATGCCRYEHAERLAGDLVALRSALNCHAKVSRLIDTKQNRTSPLLKDVWVTVGSGVAKNTRSPVNLRGLTVGKCGPRVARNALIPHPTQP